MGTGKEMGAPTMHWLHGCTVSILITDQSYFNQHRRPQRKLRVTQTLSVGSTTPSPGKVKKKNLDPHSARITAVPSGHERTDMHANTCTHTS